jgi:excisionase family DNA binding protein
MSSVFVLTQEQLSEAVENAVLKALKAYGPNKSQSTLIDRKELMKRLNVSEPTLIAWGQKGKVPEIRIGKSVRYDYEAVKEKLKVNHEN